MTVEDQSYSILRASDGQGKFFLYSFSFNEEHFLPRFTLCHELAISFTVPTAFTTDAYRQLLRMRKEMFCIRKMQKVGRLPD